MLRGKALDDIVDGWARDLESQVKEFEQQAGEVREWDKVLVRNGNQISTLYRQVRDVQTNQEALDKNLSYIESQQKQLDGLLTHYEREIQAFTDKDTKPLAAKMPADREREKAYGLAEDLNKQLDDLSRNLSQMIEEVNKLSAAGVAPVAQQPSAAPTAADAAQQLPADPINQLSSILGAQLRTIHSIDVNATKLSSKIDDLESRLGKPQGSGAYGAPRR